MSFKILGGLESQIKLHTLIISDNQLITSKGLVDVPTVQVLDLSRNHLPVLDGIEHLGLLQTLDCRNNNLMAVSTGKNVSIRSLNVICLFYEIKKGMME